MSDPDPNCWPPQPPAPTTLPVSTVTFLKRFPEFESIPPHQIELALEDALVIMGRWKGVGKIQAQNYLAAHFLATAMQAAALVEGGGSGDIQTEKVGPFTVTYQKRDFTELSDLMTTAYGRRYKFFRDAQSRSFDVLSQNKDPDRRRFGYGYGYGADYGRFD